jgi:hypothetical protein
MAGCSDHRGSEVYILVSRAVGTATLLAMHNRNVLLNMFRRIGTVLICPANGAPFASTRHRNVVKSASNRDTGSKLAAGPVYSDGRTQILTKNKVCRP